MKLLSSKIYPGEEFNRKVADEVFKQYFTGKKTLSPDELGNIFCNSITTINELIKIQKDKKINLEEEKIKLDNILKEEKEKNNSFTTAKNVNIYIFF